MFPSKEWTPEERLELIARLARRLRAKCTDPTNGSVGGPVSAIDVLIFVRWTEHLSGNSGITVSGLELNRANLKAQTGIEIDLE